MLHKPLKNEKEYSDSLCILLMPLQMQHSDCKPLLLQLLHEIRTLLAFFVSRKSLSLQSVAFSHSAKHSLCLDALKGVVHFSKKLLLIIYSPPCHPRCPCLSFFSRKEIKLFDENIPGFFSI